MRADCPEDKRNWVEVLQSYNSELPNCVIGIQENGFHPQQQQQQHQGLRRHDSSISLQSNTLSTTSNRDVDRTGRTLKEKLHEIETFRDILYNQIDTLQRYFDACAVNSLKNNSNQNDFPFELGNGLKTIDFKGEAITFRATTAGVLTTLQHCVDIIVQKEEYLRKKLDKETERRKKAEEHLKVCQEELDKSKKVSRLGPDLEVSTIE